MIRIAAFLVLSFMAVKTISGQYNKQWYSGRYRLLNEPFSPPPLCLFTRDSDYLNVKVDSSINLYMDWYHYTMCDSIGNVQFFTNGLRIYNHLGQVMENGDSINLSMDNNYRGIWQDKDTTVGAYNGIYGCTSIPYPGRAKEYLLIYTCFYYDSFSRVAIVLNYAHVSMNYNNGLGKVISKENMLMQDFGLGNPILFKHGNGRDWWLLTYTSSQNHFYSYLIDPEGIRLFKDFIEGPIINGKSSLFQNKVSPNGNLLAVINQCNIVSIYDLDRCLGSLNLIKSINIFKNKPCPLNSDFYIEESCIKGMEFSPDSKLLYVERDSQLLQIDLFSLNSDKTYRFVDGGFLSFFQLLDDKIYMDDSYERYPYIHVLRRPNLKGLSSDMDISSIKVPNDVFYRMQLSPNYLLGKVKNTVCDSL